MKTGKMPKIKVLILHYFFDHEYLTGYAFKKELQEKGINISNGSLYPILNELEEMGVLKSKLDGKRKVYTQTKKAKKMVKDFKNFAPKEVTYGLMKVAKSIGYIDWGDKESIQGLKDNIDGVSEILSKLVKDNK